MAMGLQVLIWGQGTPQHPQGIPHTPLRAQSCSGHAAPGMETLRSFLPALPQLTGGISAAWRAQQQLAGATPGAPVVSQLNASPARGLTGFISSPCECSWAFAAQEKPPGPSLGSFCWSRAVSLCPQPATLPSVQSAGAQLGAGNSSGHGWDPYRNTESGDKGCSGGQNLTESSHRGALGHFAQDCTLSLLIPSTPQPCLVS